ncbi:type ISP restriction/modification enzyme [Nevskia ramosa]|uniref:type ISP restriction/modification enzyme n=1 Tax=Nevskia ramosa TaxID=64002 RepID=UPI001B7FC0A4|nr:type ISP restriction/modification enzyme [Nevskia ramosa]
MVEQLERKSEALTGLAADWRKLLFPDASDERFADGYAQAVTFGLLMARAQGISLKEGFGPVADALGTKHSLIGAALHLLTDNTSNQAVLKTALATLRRVLDVVDWQKLSKGNADKWLYFYEDFLDVYDRELRKETGSYYTPPEVVNAQVRWVDELLRSPAYALSAGLSAPTVTLVDPATGTGTYLLGVLRRIAGQVAAEQGEGAVPAAIQAAVPRLVGFEMQLGPYAVAQLRLLAEVVELTGAVPKQPLSVFVTDTLASPHDTAEHIFQSLKPLADQRRAANKVKRETPVTVVLGNPPYKEKAKGLGGWVEDGDASLNEAAPLDDWQAPKEWKAGAHAKHLRNLYVYFWRWASWKVWDQGPGDKTGIVCFITVAGFLNGPGFQQMRAWLRQRCNALWVVDCSPEGHQPDVSSRIFQGVQQPVCIVLASRSSKAKTPADPLARVQYRALPAAHRKQKFEALDAIRLDDDGWRDCPDELRAPFLPTSGGAWAEFPRLEDLFSWNGSGSQPGRTWVIASDSSSLVARWAALKAAQPDAMKIFFRQTSINGLPVDRHIDWKTTKSLGKQPIRPLSIASDTEGCLQPIRYAFRSFDRQWIIPDVRLINRPNPALWDLHSDKQIFVTALSRSNPSSGPAITITALIPDYDHYKGSFGGRVFPLWTDVAATQPNVLPSLLAALSTRYGLPVSAEDVVAWIAAIAAHPGYIERFREDLSTPGLRIPFTADAARFREGVALGRRVIWLHTFGERMADPAADRPAGAPRLPASERPLIPKGGAIPDNDLPETIDYDPALRRLKIGGGYIEPVAPEVWAYEVSGKSVLTQWFSYRKRDRSRPQIGDKRPPSPLGLIQPDGWLAEYTSELLDVINVLGLLVQIEPMQATLLHAVCGGPLIAESELLAAGALRLDTSAPPRPTPKVAAKAAMPIDDLFGG